MSRLVIVGPNDTGSWRELEAIVDCIGHGDVIVHTGSFAVGGKIDIIVRRRKTNRRPAVEVQHPETRYEEPKRTEQLALQLIWNHRPDEVIVFWDLREAMPPEVLAVAEMASKFELKFPVRWWEEFVAAREQRPYEGPTYADIVQAEQGGAAE